jgi:DNA-directed RNA polymerase subunit N (RpoN/RPB10)
MIIPVKCFTCGKVLADKYRYYISEVRRMKLEKGLELDKVIYMTKTNNDKAVEGIVMDNIKLTSPCCRRHMLTHVDIE